MVSTPLGGGREQPARPPRLPTPPTGWPIGSYRTYGEAQRAVDFLAEGEFPVTDVTIVGVDLMLVERVIGRMSWGRALAAGAVSGAWFGLFAGLLLGLFVNQGFPLQLLSGLALGVLAGLLFSAIGYGLSRGRRDFSSASQLVAGRYDVLCQPRTAEQGRELLAKLALKPPATPA
ncbi:general stress protein [Amycolatopsis sp. PS_44_ISF1]|uniref:general stress protein n=1 Tax=Amycolatopsis sp. PS_44_ISF1 TaxID=2974917 RepID=UPI0028DF128A|nr:general stress protein [Amycolatopsis sp. PS_44_ISF1]MDT8909411.1 magnesium transporter [Amycolatopsis sp. PS_44_ISF1]